jgi:prepilin-type N-terminal cleavage/methylation domain-containing protein
MRTTSPQQHLGVTLIELMVGLAIGLVILLAVFQIYGTWDGRQRTGSAKNDAQMVGTLAAVTLEHDLRQAAHGFGPASSPTELRTGCVTSAFFGAVFTFNLMPVEIINGAAGASDQINVLYGSSGHRSTREWVVGSTATTKTLINRAGFMAGDRVVLSNSVVANTCQLVEITAATTALVGDPRSFWHATGPYQSAYTAVGVLTNATMNDAAGTGANEFDQAFNIGPSATSQQLAYRWCVTAEAGVAKNEPVSHQWRRVRRGRGCGRHCQSAGTVRLRCRWQRTDRSQ